jgi:hypothetical protein
MQKSIWIFGGIAGILSAVLEYLFYSNENFSPMTMYLAKGLVLIISVVFGLILIRKLLGGTISIGRTLLSGALISLVRAIVLIIAFLAFYYPNGDFYNSKIQDAIELAQDKVAKDEAIKEEDKKTELEITINDIERQFKPLSYSFMAIGQSLITGLIISILTAVFISKNMMLDGVNQKQ